MFKDPNEYRVKSGIVITNDNTPKLYNIFLDELKPGDLVCINVNKKIIGNFVCVDDKTSAWEQLKLTETIKLYENN